MKVYIRHRFPPSDRQAGGEPGRTPAGVLRLSICLLLLSAAGVSGASQAQAIDTNRPGFSFSPNVVAKGTWQLETGLDYARIDSDSRSTSLPVAEVRVGVAEQIEVFLSGISWTDSETRNSSSSGFTDFSLGTKLQVTNAGAPTQMAFLFQVSLPVGDSGISSDRWDPTAAFIWSHAGALTVAGTVKVSEYSDGYQLDNGLKLPFSLSERHSVFAEWEANLPEDGGSSHWLNGGYQWVLGNQMQLDVNAGIGLNDRADDYRLGAGFSYRF